MAHQSQSDSKKLLRFLNQQISLYLLAVIDVI